MKRIFFSGIIFMSFSVISCCFGADETVTSAGKPLTVEEFIGTDDAYLEPTMFPNFYKSASTDNPTCADYLMDGDTDPKLHLNNGTGKDRWTPTSPPASKNGKYSYPYKEMSGKNEDCSLKVDGHCNYSNCARYTTGTTLFRGCNGNCQNVYKPCKEPIEYNSKSSGTSDGSPKESYEELNEGEYQAIPGLTGTVKTAKGYRNITKILFTWTVRVEGNKRLIAVWPFICHPHHKTSYQEFPPGPLKTRLFIKSEASGNGARNADNGVTGSYYSGKGEYVTGDYVPVGQIAEMTVPSAGKGKVSNIGDPTITGSYALLPSDFPPNPKGIRRLPEEVEFEVRWYNETSMRIKSPKNQRNLVATVFPITSQRSEE